MLATVVSDGGGGGGGGGGSHDIMSLGLTQA